MKRTNNSTVFCDRPQIKRKTHVRAGVIGRKKIILNAYHKHLPPTHLRHFSRGIEKFRF